LSINKKTIELNFKNIYNFKTEDAVSAPETDINQLDDELRNRIFQQLFELEQNDDSYGDDDDDLDFYDDG
jgi:hypothetical protein